MNFFISSVFPILRFPYKTIIWDEFSEYFRLRKSSSLSRFTKSCIISIILCIQLLRYAEYVVPVRIFTSAPYVCFRDVSTRMGELQTPLHENTQRSLRIHHLHRSKKYPETRRYLKLDIARTPVRWTEPPFSVPP